MFLDADAVLVVNAGQGISALRGCLVREAEIGHLDLVGHKGVGGDELVEVSVVPTDFDLNVLDEGVDYVIKPSEKAVNHMNDFVRQMHTRSGLINEWENGLSLAEAEQKVTVMQENMQGELAEQPFAAEEEAK